MSQNQRTYPGRPEENAETLARNARKRRRTKDRRLARRRKVLLLVLLLILLAVIAIGLHCLSQYLSQSPLVDCLTLEAGEELNIEDFLLEPDAYDGSKTLSYVTELDEDITTQPGEYSIEIQYGRRSFHTTLLVQDTIAPVATWEESFRLPAGTDFAPEDFITEVTDATAVSFSFLEDYDFTKEGTYDVIILITDAGDNTISCSCQVTIIEDTTAPVIDGVAHITAYIGVAVSYKQYITVTDDYDEDVTLQVDISDVNEDVAGTYEVIYSATDWAGNTTTETTTITFSELPEDYIDEETVLAYAAEILKDIVTDDMTLKEKAYAILIYVKRHLTYTGSSIKDCWTNAAMRAFADGTTNCDCYSYFSMSKALLTAAGIPNIDVEKSDTSYSRHYWCLINVGDGWYHFDTTPRKGLSEYIFLWTDEKILAFSVEHNNCFIFDSSLYPATPTVESTID